MNVISEDHHYKLEEESPHGNETASSSATGGGGGAPSDGSGGVVDGNCDDTEASKAVQAVVSSCNALNLNASQQRQRFKRFHSSSHLET